MSIKSDKWIRRMAQDHNMIEPFEYNQIKNVNGEKVISFGTSSYGYDIRCADEFKVFTNINSTIVDPKNFDPTLLSKSPARATASFRPIALLWPARWSTSAFRVGTDGLPGQIDLCALRHHRQCHPFEPEWEGYVTLEFPIPPRCRPKSMPMKAWHRCCSSSQTKCAMCPMPTAPANTWARLALPCHALIHGHCAQAGKDKDSLRCPFYFMCIKIRSHFAACSRMNCG
jgi:dCTP deaminase